MIIVLMVGVSRCRTVVVVIGYGVHPRGHKGNTNYKTDNPHYQTVDARST